MDEIGELLLGMLLGGLLCVGFAFLLQRIQGRPPVLSKTPRWAAAFFDGRVEVLLYDTTPEERLMAAHSMLRLSRMSDRKGPINA